MGRQKGSAQEPQRQRQQQSAEQQGQNSLDRIHGKAMR
jgi:hypothetical protein